MATVATLALDSRDRSPPPAPKKLRPSQPSPTEVGVPLFSLSGPAPDAPIAERTRKLRLYDQLPRVRALAAELIAQVWYPAWREAIREANRSDLSLDSCPYEALNEVVEVTPLALPEGELKSLLLEHVGAMTFLWEINDLWVDHASGVVTVRVDKDPVGSSLRPPQLKYEFAVDKLKVPPAADKSVHADNGHFEFQKIGKGGREWFWVEAKAVN